VVAAWAAVIVLSFGAIAVLLGDTLTSEGEVTATTESSRAEEIAAQSFPRGPRTSSVTSSSSALPR
jgi:hypothetical protein